MGFKDREDKRASAGVVSSIVTRSPYKEKLGRSPDKGELVIRKTITVLPSVWDDLKKIAYVERIPVSQIVSQLVLEYIAKNKESLKEFEDLRK